MSQHAVNFGLEDGFQRTFTKVKPFPLLHEIDFLENAPSIVAGKR